MQASIAKKLIKLNHEFYQTFAESFSATRQRIQPGVSQILDMIPPTARLLDLGCGNGNLAHELAERGFLGSYLGLDFSTNLVQIASKKLPPNAKIQQADLTDPIWDVSLPDHAFDVILCFATMHHFPGEALRVEFLAKTHNLCTPGGCFIFSNWQFLNSPKLKARIQDWGQVGLSKEDVDKGDYLLDWRRDGQGLRYVHQYSSGELHNLAARTNFQVNGLFTSDGETGDLGLYMIWEPKEID